jgi:quercetin dioxygenase-like cupin family protein
VSEPPRPSGNPNWTPLPRAGCVGVETRVVLVDDDLGVAMLRFAIGGTIDEHSAPHDIEVVCLDGSGFTSVDGDRWALNAGEVVRWPRDRRHRLWTDDSTMTTLMLERLRAR